MNGLPFVILAIVLSLGMQSPKGSGPSGPKPSGPQPAPKQPAPSKKGKVVPVEIIVGPIDTLQNHCKGGKPISTIYVATPTKTVYHCIGNTLHNHADHAKNAALNKADVYLNDGDAVRWFTQTTPYNFTVSSVVKSKEPPQAGAAPAFPFAKPFAPKAASEVVSAPVVFIDGKIQQRYKVTFNITGLGAVDPDLICTM